MGLHLSRKGNKAQKAQVLIYSGSTKFSPPPRGLLLSSGAAACYAWLTSVQPYTEIFCPNVHKANYFGKLERTIKYKTSSVLNLQDTSPPWKKKKMKSLFLALFQDLVWGKIQLCFYLGISRRSYIFFPLDTSIDYYLFSFLAVTPPTPCIVSSNMLFGQKIFISSTTVLKVNKVPCLPNAKTKDFE